MSSKTYEQKVARLVQEATGAAYMTALRWTNEHVATHPDRMTKEEAPSPSPKNKRPERT